MNKTNEPAINLDTKKVSEMVQEMKKHLANAQRLQESTKESIKINEDLKTEIQEAAIEGDFRKLTNLNQQRIVHETRTGAARERGIESNQKLEEARKELIAYLVNVPAEQELSAVESSAEENPSIEKVA